MTATGIHASDLEPSLVSDRTYVARRRPVRLDAAALLGLVICLIALVPSNLIVPGMTPVGRPGLIVGFLLFCWWVLVHCASHLAVTGPQPMRWAVLLFVITALLSYAAGFLRGLTTMEANSADRTMLFLGVLTGVLLTAADGVPNWGRLRSVLKVLVVCASAVALIALVQYVFLVDLTRYLVFPGLATTTSAIGFEARGAGIRVPGTTTHYIELAAFLALTLPFAIHFACFGRRRWPRRLALAAALVIASGVAATISRTGVVAVVVIFAVLLPVWHWRMRYNIAAVTAGALAALTVVNPGLVSTLLGLFDDPSSNPAFTVRTERYPLVFGHFAERPWLGRGTGTWVAPQYQILDNQWLVTLVSGGAIGVLALAGLHLTAIALAGIALRRARTAEDRHLCAALISTSVIGVVVAGTFDALSFSTYATVLALTLGLCGAVWRLTHPSWPVRTTTTGWSLDGKT